MTACPSPASSSTPHHPRARPKVLYLLGTQRGGTTIAGRLIGQLPGFAFVGELRKLWQVGLPEGRSCGCGKGYRECEVWSAVLPQVMGGTDVAVIQRWQRHAAPDRRSSLRAWRLAHSKGGRHRSSIQSYASLMAATYAALAETMHARVVVDTSKLPADALVLSRLDNVDSYFIELVRDPRGTVYSAIRRSGGRSFFHPRQGAAGSAGWLVRHLAAAARLRAAGPGRAMVVTYERLVDQPQAVLTEIAALVGEPAPAAEVVVNGRVALDVAHTPIGGGRFGPVTVELARDDRWVTALSPADRLVVSALTGPLARHFGYFRPPPSGNQRT